MGIPSNRTPVRVARGATTAFTDNSNAGIEELADGEIIWDTTTERFRYKSGGTGGSLKDHTVDTSGFATLTGATFTGDVKLGDGDYLKLGDSDDLSVHHVADGDTFIVNNAALYTRGTELYFQAEGDPHKEWIHCLPAGSVELSYDDSKKFETTDTGVKVTGVAVPAGFTSLSSSSNSTAVNLGLNNNFDLTLNEISTLAQPSNQSPGQSGSIFITQGTGGGFTLGYHDDWKWTGGNTPQLSEAESAIDRIDYIVAAANKVHAVASLDVKTGTT